MSLPESREEALFDGALQLPSEHRARYLEAACGSDTALRRRIQALLAAHDQEGGPLARPALPTAQDTLTVALPPLEKPGDRIGRYKLLQLIGEGGCGSVYMAEQEEPVRRRVALKVIKLGMDTKAVVARFEAERQALALMEHPNIAKVFDAGTTDTGRPFFVMELVRGIKITDYCDQNRLPTSERLALFREVCRAVQHAHQKGIIHRDIKPSNILVTLHDGVPVPKVIDFGIAKATDRRLTDKTVFTQFEQIIGTPAYMSPEQAEMSSLDIDTRTDIYSLGVLLYELLTSHTPFDATELLSAGLDVMRRLIREKEPPKPSTRLSTLLDADLTEVAQRRDAAPPKLIHLIKGDLDWIVMKALEKDRTRRYDTASSFASDIDHFLKNEPVSACPPSTIYRFQKLVRRNKVAFAAVAAVALSLIAGMVVSTWMFLREQEARQAAVRSALRSEQVAHFLEDMLKGVGPGVALGRDTKLLREILDNTAARVTTDLKDQPEVQAEICNTLGEVYRALGLSGKAEQLHRTARSVQDRARHVQRGDVAVSLNDLALVLRDLGKFAEAEALHRQALELQRKLYGREYAEVADTLNNLALVVRSEGRIAEAIRLHREALEMQEKLFGHEHLAVATSLNNLAIAIRDGGSPADAEPLFRDSIGIQERILGDNQPALAITLDNLAFTLCREAKLTDAEDVEERALAMEWKLFGPEHPYLATAIHDMALIRTAQNRFADADKLHEQALAMRRKLLGDEHPEVAASLNNLALLRRKEKKLADAEHLAREALAVRKKFYGEQHVAVSSSLDALALVLADENKLSEAQTCLEHAIGIDRKFLDDSHPAVAAAVRHLADLLERQHKDAQLAELSKTGWVAAHNMLAAGRTDSGADTLPALP